MRRRLGQREGYTCQVLPLLGVEGEPRFCLMQPKCTTECVMDEAACMDR